MTKPCLTEFHECIRHGRQNRFHLGFYVPKNGAAKPPTPLAAFCNREAETTPSRSTGDWALTFWNSDRFAGVLFYGGEIADW